MSQWNFFWHLKSHLTLLLERCGKWAKREGEVEGGSEPAALASATDEIKLQSFPPPPMVREARKMKGSFFARENPTLKSQG